MKTLISMTDFVLSEIKEPYTDSEKLRVITNYANFLKQPLKLEMFVPCDDEGNVLEEPDEYQDFLKIDQQGIMRWGYNIYNHCKNYQQAKEKVLFEGFYWEGNYAVCMAEDEMIYIDDEFMQNMTIDKFLTTIITDLQLTPTALKQIGI